MGEGEVGERFNTISTQEYNFCFKHSVLSLARINDIPLLYTCSGRSFCNSGLDGLVVECKDDTLGTWYGKVCYGMLWYGMVCYCVVWYGMVWYGRYCGSSKADSQARIGQISTLLHPGHFALKAE